MLKFFDENLDALQHAYLLALCVPAALLVVALKILRVLGTDNAVGVLYGIDAFKSELFLVAGLALGGVWVLDVVSKARPRRAAMALLQIVWLVVLIIEVSGHQFFVSTGSSLDYYLLAFSLENFAGNAEVITSEAPGWVFVLGPLAVGWLVVTPWLVRWRLARRDQMGHAQTSRSLPTSLIGVVSVALLAGAILPPLFAQANALARSTTVNVALSASGALQESLKEPLKANSGALKTRLEPAPSTKKGKSANAARPRNLAIIVLESTRARSTSVYNPELESTPYLAGLATRSTVAKRAFAVVPHTSKALVATLCGIEPRLRMPITEAVAGNIPAHCLADLLGSVGYQTAYFQSAFEYFENREQLVDNMGYETFVPVDDMDTTGFDKVNYFGREDNIMLAPSRAWLEANRHRPFFTTYLTLTPHHNYTNPRRYGSRDFVQGDNRLNRYINTIFYVDNFAKNLINQYKELGLYEDTVFVFVGDHGEAFGEHGRHQHDNVIYDEGLHVPLIIHDPKAPEQKLIDLPVNQLDLLPTLVEMLGYQITGGEYPGANIYELDEVRPLRAHCWYERRCVAEILGDEKYIHHFGSRPDEFFNLTDDPLEKTNLAAERGDLEERRKRLLAWRSRINAIYRTHADEALGRFILDEVPDIEHRLDATLGDEVELLGYDLSDDSVRPGDTFTVTYYFRSKAQVSDGWKLFVHGEGSGPFQNLDHAPISGLYPVQDWKPGEIIVDAHQIRVPGNWKPGHFDVYVGIWHPEEGRKEVSGDVETDGENRAKVTRIVVEPKKSRTGSDAR